MLIYLASPWSHPDPAVRERRYLQARQATAAIIRAGKPVFSPVVYSYHLAEDGGLPGDWGFWQEFDEALISRCSFLWVLTLDGWRESKGVAAEIDLAARLNKPMRCYSLEELLEGRF